MAILCKASNNSIHAIDVQNALTVAAGSVILEDIAGNKFREAHIAVFAAGEQHITISALVPEKMRRDHSILCDLFSFVAKEIVTNIYEGMRGRERKQDFNLVAITDDIVKSNISPADSPKLEQWFTFGNQVRAKLLEEGVYFDQCVYIDNKFPVDISKLLNIGGKSDGEKSNSGVQG